MAGSFSGLVDPTDLQSGKQLINGQTITQIIKQSLSGIGSLTALAGGGSVGAVLCNNYINEFTTVASANDSCILPPALAGIEVTVINSGAQNLRVYCQTANVNNPNASGTPQADTIVPLAGGTAAYVTISANGIGVFSAPTLGRWKSQNV